MCIFYNNYFSLQMFLFLCIVIYRMWFRIPVRKLNFVLFLGNIAWNRDIFVLTYTKAYRSRMYRLENLISNTPIATESAT